MTTASMPYNLTAAQIEEFGREMDAIRDEVLRLRGERDRHYILKVIRTQRSMAVIGRFIIYAGLFFVPAWGHALASWAACLSIMGLALPCSASPRSSRTWRSPTTCCTHSGTG